MTGADDARTRAADLQTAIRESEERFARIVSIAADAIISIDSAQRITMFNQGAERMFGYAAEEVLGQPLALLLPPDAQARHVEEVRGFAASPDVARQMAQRRHIFGRRKSGDVFSAEASISKASIGGELVFTAVVRDVSERWAVEEEKSRLLAEAQAAREIAEQAARQRDEMMAIVSHDLRNPLSAISMCADAIAEDDTLEQRRRHADTIRQSVELANKLIADLGDITSIEAGTLSVQRRSVDPLLIVAQALDVFEMPAAERGIRLRATGADSLPAVAGDPARLLQVTANLVANALRFTDTGGTISVGAEAGTDGRSVTFSVSDTGRGIHEDDLPLVFERRWHTGIAGPHGGTGLGLAIARGIVDAHGGRIWVESERGRGTRVYFSVPTSAA